MVATEDLFTKRKSLDQICSVPDRIISVYSLERHVWADSNSEDARRDRRPELQTLEEFQINPVRPFLTDILRNMAAPYHPDKKENPVGQGYWIQAEFGSGKSHLLCFLSALALGSPAAWGIVKRKEEQAGRGKRESLHRFWEEGLQAKGSGGKRGIFVVVKTLVGSGSGTVGRDDKGKTLTEYILDAVKEQLIVETGKNLSLYPTELLADRFMAKDVDRYRADLKKFLKDPRYFSEDEFMEIDDFLRVIQENRSPEYKRSCGNKLWRFYDEYLEVNPQVAAEPEAVLKHMVQTLLGEGYSGVLLVLDEMSLFMKNRVEDQRIDDEKTLAVLSNRLAKVENLPLWTVCAAQQALESKMGVKNIVADDRLKLVKLLEADQDYYDIVLNRVREITDEPAIANYYLYYKRGFSWPNSIGQKEFTAFFPFHKPALEALRAITYELTTARSAIHFMHQTLKHQIKVQGAELIRLWELFDEAVRYEEDPSGVHAGLVAIKTKREAEYLAYEACRRQIDGLTKGPLKVYRDKGVRTVQTLFLYHIGRTRQQGLTPEEIANSVLIERKPDADVQENLEHYESIAENLKKELPQVAESLDEDRRPRYRFDPVVTGKDPRKEFEKARSGAEGNEVLQKEAWEHLLALDEWPVRTRQITMDLSNGVKSIFKDIAPFSAPWKSQSLSAAKEQEIELVWQGRQVSGLVAMRDLVKAEGDGLALVAISSEETERDFAVFVGLKPVKAETITKLLERKKDPRVLLWTPGELRTEEKDRLLDFAAYRKLVADWQGKDSEDGVGVINWVLDQLRSSMGSIYKIVPDSYGRGRIDALDNSEMSFKAAGELGTILSPLVERVLTAAYQSRDIAFDPPFIFRKEEGVKVINGIVKLGEIPKGAKPNKDLSAAQNFGFGLKILRRGNDRKLDTSENPHLRDLWSFLDSKLADEGQTMKVETLYKNFMGIGGPGSKNYGLSRRMVQIYLLCLVREGKVRVGLGPKSGLPHPHVDYSNMADIEFSAGVLAALTEVQKVARPENWEVLRPYAEKLLEGAIPANLDDGAVSGYRTKLRNLFAREKEESGRAVSRSSELFTVLRTANPYEKELSQVAGLFATDLSSGDDIALILYALKERLGYQAFDTDSASQQEADDLGNRLRNYRDVVRFLGYDWKLRVARTYCDQSLPEGATLKPIREAQASLGVKLGKLSTYIDSEVKLKTELVGQFPPAPGESGTLGCLIRDYSAAYVALHDTVQGAAEGAQARIEELLAGDELRALGKLEGISLLRPPASPKLTADLQALSGRIAQCPMASRASIEKQLQSEPVHQCGLTFENAPERVEAAQNTTDTARCLMETALDQAMSLFLAPAVVQRLEQGKGEPVIARLLGCRTSGEVGAVLIPAVLRDESIVALINRYLKRIVLKKVRLADFKPTHNTIEPAQIPTLVREIQRFLEQQVAAIEDGGDSLPVIQLE